MITPRAMLWVRDETSSWSTDFRREVRSKIIATYLFDARQQTHCCESTPSYEMEVVNTFLLTPPENEDEAEKFEGQLIEGMCNSPQSMYVHCRSIDPLIREATDKWDYKTLPAVVEVDDCGITTWENFLADEDDDRDAAHKVYMEGIIEDLHGNPVVS